MARLGEAFADQRSAGTISQWEQYARNLEYWLAQYREEYDLLMNYTDELKKIYSRVTSDISGTYQIECPPPPAGVITSLKARVTQINFFESGGDLPQKEDRLYKTAFPKSITRYIWCEYNLYHLPQAQRLDYSIEMQWYSVADLKTETYYSSQSSFYISPEWETSHFAGGCGYKEMGSWKEGKYLVVIFIAGEYAGTGVFDIL
jgi:hypothetical protein